MNYKKYFFFSIFSVALCIMLLSFLFVFVVFYDNPLQVNTQGYFYTERYHNDMRSQAPGIIKNVDFDGIILGTSVTENTSAMEASKLLDGRFVNLSMMGATFYERNIVLNYIFSQKKMKNIMYTVDSRYVKMLEASTYLNDWELLYDDDVWNDIEVIYEKNVLSTYLKNIFKREKKVYSELDFFDRPHAWFQGAYSYVKFGGLQNWVKTMHQEQIREFIMETLPEVAAKVPLTPAALQITDVVKKNIAYVDKYLLSHIKNHPETKFQLIFPPYYRFTFAQMRQVDAEEYAAHQHLIRHLTHFSAQYTHVEVYGFEDQDFVGDIARYRDTRHFDEPINSYITQSIAKKKHMLTPENVEAYLARCEKLALAFDIAAFNDEAQRLVRLHWDGKKTAWLSQ